MSEQHERAKRKRRRKRNRAGSKSPGFSVELGGRTLYLQPPDRDGIREVEQFILSRRRSPLDIAKEKLDGLSPELQEVLIRDALAREATMPNSISEHDFAAAIDSREGAALVLWIMVRRNHPDVTQEDCESMMFAASEEEFRKHLAERDEMVE